MKISRLFPNNLAAHWRDHKGLIQVFLGPRQVGKTTAAVALAAPLNTIFFSADAPAPPSALVIEEQWVLARAIEDPDRTLILDEIQKVPGWSEIVKRLWEEDKRNGVRLRVALLGSSALLIEKGLSESLAGRFEINFFPHWCLSEVRQLTSVDLDRFLVLGGYPKAYDFGDDLERARSYIENSIIEPMLGRDILALHAVDKPALLRQLFWYVTKLPAQIVSFEKILGSLQDRGNSAPLVHYAELLRLAFAVVPIFKFSAAENRTKRSLPKWIFPNSALVSRPLDASSQRGFLIENLVGGHLLNLAYGRPRFELCYWRDGDLEIDFVLVDDHRPILALEIKSGRKKTAPPVTTLAAAGLKCDVGAINSDNIEPFLMTTSLEQALQIAKPSRVTS